jgi:putative transcriptional regulator
VALSGIDLPKVFQRRLEFSRKKTIKKSCRRFKERVSMSDMFDLLKKGLTEALEHVKGERKLCVNRIKVSEAPDSFSKKEIKGIREQLNCSQAVFAMILNVDIKTVQAWEVGGRKPSGLALRMLQICKDSPGLILDLLVVQPKDLNEERMVVN